MHRMSACWGFPASQPTPGTAGVSLNRVGVYGQVEDSPPVPAGFRAGVLGAASTQPGIIGFSRDGDGIQGASFASTAVRAVSFFGPGVQSISGALTGVTGISGTQGPTPTGNLPDQRRRARQFRTRKSA